MLDPQVLEQLRKRYGDRIVDHAMGLRLADDVAFRYAIERHPNLVDEVIRPFMGGKAFRVAQTDLQRPVGGVFGKTVVFDAFVVLEDGTMIDVEVQIKERDFPPERAFFYSAALLSQAIGRGDTYESVPPTIVIVLTERDPFGKRRGLYDLAYADVSIPIEPFVLRNSPRIIFANRKCADGKTELGSLLADLFQPNPALIRNAVARGAMEDLKYGEGGFSNMCERESTMYDMGHNEGFIQGRAEGRIETIVSLYADGVLTLAQAAERAELTQDEILRLAREAKA